MMLKAAARSVIPSPAYLRLAGMKREMLRLAGAGLVRALRTLPLTSRLAIRAGLEAELPLDHPTVGVRLLVESELEAGLRAQACAKEPGTVRWIESLFRGGDVFYDIGANVGAYALLAARRHPGVRVVAFEPSFASYAQLCRNVVLNRCEATVITLPIALSDDTGLASFHYHDLRAGSALHSLTSNGAAVDAGVASQTIMRWRLDDLIARLGLPRPVHVKVDVDGHELAVLRGAERTLEDPGVRSVLVEVLGGSDAEAGVLALASSKGFTVRDRERFPVRTGAATDAYNYLLTR
jgi:FkbM family methyltransferase